ncbi:ankyrin repeat-containing domain protein [Aspergillus pseudoustus]|uniref:Ankyrin repeat-containing domain protein n=1 Tax=Aspergillus pseudoustus TaxID=1810923 RepID=A0ABR4INN1_9EURO
MVMALLLNIPNEILLLIVTHLSTQALGRLTATCRSAHDRLNSFLYSKGLEGETTVLDWAATTGNQSTVHRVFEYTTPSLGLIESAMNNAIPKNLITIVRLLLDRGLPPWDPASAREGAVSSPLFRAGMCRNFEIVNMLLDAGARPHGYSDEEIGFLVHFSTTWENGPNMEEEAGQQSNEPFDPRILQLLVQHGLSISSPEVVHQAIALGCKVPLISFLVDLGLDPNARSYIWHTPLYYVLSKRGMDSEDCVALIKKCVEHGLDVNLRDAQSVTVLHKAAEKAHPAVIRELISAGAELYAFDMYGRTPVQVAIMRGNVSPEILRAFFNTDVEMPQAVTHRLGSMLLRMIKSRKLECISLLLRKGLEAIPNVSTSILVLAAATVGDVAIVRQLLHEYPDVDLMNTRDHDGNTALKIAMKWGYSDVVRILTSHMSSIVAP